MGVGNSVTWAGAGAGKARRYLTGRQWVGYNRWLRGGMGRGNVMMDSAMFAWLFWVAYLVATLVVVVGLACTIVYRHTRGK